MPPVIIQGGIILNPDDTGAQQLQAHALHIGLDYIHIFHATLAGKGYTYLVLNKSHPVFQDISPEVIKDYLDSMAQTHNTNRKRGSALAKSEGLPSNRRKA